MKNKSEFDKKIQDDFFNLTVFNKLASLFDDKFSDLIKEHNDSTKESIDHIDKAITNSDSGILERTAHSIKGASAQFGGTLLSHLAENMEKLGKDGDFENARELYPALKKAQEETAALMLKQI